MADLSHHAEQAEPLILTVPGLDNSGPGHWQTLWENSRGDCRRVDLGMWDRPHRNTWVNKLNLALHKAQHPVVLCAQGLGCLAAAWWVEYERPKFGEPVVGAIFISPPDVDRPGLDPRLARFGACPRETLPFPSYLVVKPDLPMFERVSAIRLARDWGSYFIDDSGGRRDGTEPASWTPDYGLLHSLERKSAADISQRH